MQHNKIFEFLQTIDDIYGVYIDSTHGFDTVRNNFIKTQKLLKIPDEELKEKNIYYGRGNPNHKNSYPLHHCTQEEFKRRNEINGKNYIIIANLCLVQIYQYWENHYRKQIADEMNQKNLNSDIMGDLKYFRESIIHHRGIALESIEKCKILKWYKVNDRICIDKEKFEQIIWLIKNWLINIDHVK